MKYWIFERFVFLFEFTTNKSLIMKKKIKQECYNNNSYMDNILALPFKIKLRVVKILIDCFTIFCLNFRLFWFL